MRSHSAMTMTEVVMALGLMASLALWWRPLLQLTVAVPPAADLDYYQAAAAIERYVSESEILTVATSQLKVKHVGPRTQLEQIRILERLASSVDGRDYLQFSAIGTSGSEKGYSPLLYGALQIRFTLLRPGVVQYQLTMLSGSQYTGVAIDATAR
ncbi:MAG: hypothetical protein LKJ29_05370 [Lactobacillus sp.]|uniref:Uncharacterized protein n=1 Tax=Lacticaseibacillus suilingensis TaxID=2799577 RepID=A0ABW4BIB3_9LACO|nr:hypothetical protein [Lacticaseibacillus suilingensis]MCI1894147.1 hypothetical protein [Lactobacillus sp.]MCI1941463.1 hypothetical protein [Lactobacillus sp.]MCI2016131.1 hypothetical protein [Lactobacillus sp.]MCI2036436.1 hypothetical protein [Lactobacillus sp.]